MKKLRINSKRALSIALSLLMIVSAIPFAGVQLAPAAQAQTPAPVSETEPVTVIACSDYQYRTTDVYNVGATGNAGGEIVVGNIASQMASAGISAADGFICAGDFTYASGRSESNTHNGIASLKSAASAVTDSSTEYVMVQGNHDPLSTAGGTAPSGDNDPASGAYGVFVINERDYQWGTTGIDPEKTLELMETMRRYFNSKIAVSYTAPIFVVSHVPLHFSMRTKELGDNSYAKYIFDVLQEGADQGLNIIYLFGHNHSNGFDDYLGGAKIFLTPGDSINIAEEGSRTTYTTETLNFVYMNAGYTGYWERYNTATEATDMNFDISDLSMTSFTITDTTVTINRYGTSGATNLKNAGIRNWHKNEDTFSPTYPVNTNAVTSPYVLNLTAAVDDTEYEIDPVVETVITDESTVFTYPRITDASQLVDGGKYILVGTGVVNSSNSYTAASQSYFMSHETVNGTISGVTINCMNRASVPSGFSHSTVSIDGAYRGYEWTFTKSGSGWLISTGGQYLSMSKASSSSTNYQYHLTLSQTGSVFTVGTSRTNEFTLSTTVSGTSVMVDGNTSYQYLKGYNASRCNDRASFAFYGAKLLTGQTEQRYVRQNVTGTGSLEANATYLIIERDNSRAIYSGYFNTAPPVAIETDTDGTKYVSYGNSHDLEWTWVNTTGSSYNFRANDGVNWMEAHANEGSTTYERATSLEVGATYVILPSNTSYNYAMTSTLRNTWRLARQSVTVSGNTLTANSYDLIEWTVSQGSSSSTYVLTNSGKNLRLNTSSEMASTNTSYNQLNINFNSSGNATISRTGSSSTYYLQHDNGSSRFTVGTGNADTFRLYKKVVTPGEGYYFHVGTSTTNSVGFPYINNGSAVIRVYNSDGTLSDVGGGRAIRFDADNNRFVPTRNNNGSYFDFYKLTTIALPDTFTNITVSANGQNGSGSPIQSISLSGNEATLYVGNITASTYTGLYFNIVYANGNRDVTQVPVKVGDLIDYTGHQDVASLCGEPTTLTGLGAYYSEADGAWFSQLILHLIEKEDYPEYPNEGSVKVGKSSGSPNFLTNGVTQVELTATGVPLNPGIDIVLMIDTSSSMTNTIEGVQRIQALKDSIDALLDTLSAPNETTGMTPDITMAIADFNGYYDTTEAYGSNQSYISRSDIPTGSSPRSSTNTAQHCTILTGPNAGSETYDNAAFIPVADLNNPESENYFNAQGIQTKSGTNYDAAFLTVYKLFEARQAYNAARQEDRQTVVIFMSDGGPFQYNFFTSQSSTTLWNNWMQGTYDESIPSSLAQLKADFNGGGHWYFYNGTGNPNRFAEAVKGDPDHMYTIVTKDPDAYCNDRNSDGFCDLCGKCNGDCVDHDHDGLCDLCGHINQCVHSDANNDGFCDVCGECMDGCQYYQYLTQVHGLGATVYSIMFCPAQDNLITEASLDFVIKSVATSDDKSYSTNTPSELTDAFLDIASNFVQAGTNAYFTDVMGAAYDIQTATVFTKNNGEFERTYTLDPRPTIEVKKHDIYTRADYENGVISNYNQIGTRKGTSTTVEVVSFNDDGTQGFSDQIDNGNTNIYINGVIYAKSFIYNNTPASVMIDTDGDGENDFSLSSETFYWKIGIIEDTEYALTYWLYLTGSMEGTRDPGSFQTNQAAILWYDNYLGHPCYKEVFSPVQAWEAATITYEYYLVNELGQPVNSAGEVVPFANRVLVGNPQSETFDLNASSSTQADFHVPLDQLPEGYRMYNPEASFTVAIYSGDDYNTSIARINDTADVCTTYYYGTRGTWNQNGDVPGSLVDDYANTHVAFGIMYVLSIIPDTVVIDYGLPVKIHVLQNDLALKVSTRINAIGAALVDETETNHGYESSRLVGGAQSLTLNHGTAAVVNGNTMAETYVTYTPADMQMSAEEVLFYEVLQDSIYYYTKITVIPAANIYYEDSFLNFIDGSGANAAYTWQTAGETYQNKYQAEDRPGTFAIATLDANNVYGNDAAYDDSVATYSLGSARYVTLDTNAKPTVGISPRAEFTFCGTGFDVISVTSANTGALTLTVKDQEGNTVSRQVIGTFYGYSYGRLYLNRLGRVTLQPTDDDGNENTPLYNYAHTTDMYAPAAEDGEFLVRVNGRVYTTVCHLDENDAPYDYAYGWLAETTRDGALYQIPVLKTRDLDYGVYTVTLQPRYAAMYDPSHAGHYDVYIDGIRVYNPAGTGDDVSAVVGEAYDQDFERNAIFAEVRDTVISDTEGFLHTTEGVGDEAVGGSIMVDGMFVTAGSALALSNLQQSGPNNEMYLAQYQAIAFKPAVVASKSPASFQLGMKVAITGKIGDTDEFLPSNASVRIIISDVKRQMIKQITSLTVSGSAEQFYDLSALLSWTKAEDADLYVCDYDVVILNDSDVVLSLTTFKIAFTSEEVARQAEFSFTSDRRTLQFATRAIKSAVSPIDTSTLNIFWNTTDLTAGAEAVLNVTTSSDITSVVLGDTEVTEFVTNPNGTRTWSCAFTVQQKEDQALSIVLYDAFGRESEQFTAYLPSEETPEEPGEPTTPTDPTDPTTPTDPTDPTTPTDPTDPTTPTNPTEPSDPGSSDSGEGGGGSSGLSFFQKIVNWLRNFFQKIVSLFRR